MNPLKREKKKKKEKEKKKKKKEEKEKKHAVYFFTHPSGLIRCTFQLLLESVKVGLGLVQIVLSLFLL